MKGAFIAFFLAAYTVCGPALAALVAVEERFAEAARVYDEGAYSEAVEIYEQLVRDGFRSAALFYNLGNAYYRQGAIGPAVLHLRQASYLSPRDRDIRHNLAFAIDEAHAVMNPLPFPIRSLRLLSLSEWIWVAVAAWWLTAFYTALALWPGQRRGWGATATVLVIVLAISLVGVFQWWHLRVKPEVVVMKGGQEALFAPLEDRSTAHFALPEGSVVRVAAESDGWYRVRVGDKSGWIRQTAVQRILP